ncbi:MAG: hypothetical protein IPL28_18205 [Chloroflexi bacterium]|nr:hypothetical protein [Chloroflexota bacterium]
MRLNGENESLPGRPCPWSQNYARQRCGCLCVWFSGRKRRNPSWQLTAANQPAVAELCQRLDVACRWPSNRLPPALNSLPRGDAGLPGCKRLAG